MPSRERNCLAAAESMQASVGLVAASALALLSLTLTGAAGPLVAFHGLGHDQADHRGTREHTAAGARIQPVPLLKRELHGERGHHRG
ncbi:MAG: hypothetical protein ACK56F_06115, partial [bacterium]